MILPPILRKPARLAGFLVAALLVLSAGSAIAQSEARTPVAPEIDTAVTAEEFEAFLGRLSDEQVRIVAIEEFRSNRSAAAASEGGLSASLRDVLTEISSNFHRMITYWPEIGAGYGIIADRLEGSGGVFLTFVAGFISILAGAVVRYYWRRRAAQHQMEIAERNAEYGAYGTLGTIGDSFLFLAIDLSSGVAFGITAIATLYVFFPSDDIRATVSTAIMIITVMIMIRSVIVVMFPRNYPKYRLVAIDDGATATFHWTVTILAALWVYGGNVGELMLNFGTEPDVVGLTAFTSSIFWIAAAIIGTVRLHQQTKHLLPPADTPGLTAALARRWPLLVCLGFFSTWMLYTGGGILYGGAQEAGAANLKLLTMVICFWWGYRVLVHYLRAQNLPTAINDSVLRLTRAALVAVGLIMALTIWGVDPATLRQSGPTGQIILSIVNVAITALVGWAIWDIIRTLIDYKIALEAPDDEEEETEGEGGLGASRSATLLPLLRSSALVVIAITCLFAIASSLGVNIAPLIAGAGVVGLAIGFGAQTLVRDIVSGVFFLIDDAFRRGEYIDLGAVKGTVERISVRSLQLRHHLGAVHTIPFGEISALTNYSRDWVIMKLPLRLTFDTDPQKVKKIIKRIGAELAVDELLGKGLLQPPKSQGVVQMEDSAMILRVKFMAIPGKQFTLRRELLHRIRAAFEEEGIRFANREVTVRVDEGASHAEKLEAARGAATRAIEEQQPAT